jgi:regulator of sigma E protease
VGIEPGDTLLSVNGEEKSSWEEFITSMASLEPGEKVSIGYSRDGEPRQVDVILAENEGRAVIGVTAQRQREDVPLSEAFTSSVGFVGYVGQAIVQLFNPETFQQTISQSSSVVGVSVEAKNAASQGFMPFMILCAALSISIGLMNLLPIPPLDGGRIVVETIQRIIRRPISARVVNYMSVAGMALLLLLFFVCTTQDVQRYFLGG